MSVCDDAAQPNMRRRPPSLDGCRHTTPASAPAGVDAYDGTIGRRDKYNKAATLRARIKGTWWIKWKPDNEKNTEMHKHSLRWDD